MNIEQNKQIVRSTGEIFKDYFKWNILLNVIFAGLFVFYAVINMLFYEQVSLTYFVSTLQSLIFLACLACIFPNPIIFIIVWLQSWARPIKEQDSYLKILFPIGLFLSWIELILAPMLSDIVFVDWQEQLINNQRHSPFWLESSPTLLMSLFVALIGYLLLIYRPFEKTPPLQQVLAIAAIYLGWVGSSAICLADRLYWSLFLLFTWLYSSAIQSENSVMESTKSDAFGKR